MPLIYRKWPANAPRRQSGERHGPVVHAARFAGHACGRAAQGMRLTPVSHSPGLAHARVSRGYAAAVFRLDIWGFAVRSGAGTEAAKSLDAPDHQRAVSKPSALPARLARWMQLWVVLGSCLWFLSAGAAMAGDAIALLLSERGPAYDEAADAFLARLGDTRGVRVLYAEDLDTKGMQALVREIGLLVPVGTRATRQVAEHVGRNTAVLALMLPRSAFDAENWPVALPRRRLSAVFIDQPPARSLALIERLLPQVKQVAVLYTQRTRAEINALQKGADHRRVALRAHEIGHAGEVASGLRQVLPGSDVLLLLPDAQVVNANNVQYLLLTAYRYRVPVVGFSQGLIKAGAIAAVYSTPAQIGAQGGDIARQWRLGEGDLPAPTYCNEFSLAFNTHVARSLGITLPDETAVRQQLGAEP